MRSSRSRTPLRLQEQWKELVSRMRRISITLKWDEAYFAPVYSALMRNAHKVPELTICLPNGRERAGRMELKMYEKFLREISKITTLRMIKLGCQTSRAMYTLYSPSPKYVAHLTGAQVYTFCVFCGGHLRNKVRRCRESRCATAPRIGRLLKRFPETSHMGRCMKLLGCYVWGISLHLWHLKYM